MTTLGNIRDVAIIILAILSIVIGVLLIVLLVQLQRLIKLLREEIRPILNSAGETVGTVRGTTTFMSRHLIKPLVDISSTAAGLRRAFQVLSTWPKGAGSSHSGDSHTAS
ncbi:MAG: hypothetical protein ACUVWB_08025 [Anaerolineae bacterium]